MLYFHKRQRVKGFTLMELMVVIAIISICGYVISPHIKKFYEDFMIKQTVNEFVDIMNACRSHYLIFNEFPNDGGGGEIPKNLSFFVPSNFFNKTLYAGYAGKNYDFTSVPP